ncbi:MAG: transglutaminase family protein [Comamonadaceae bacterium]|nr:transglutaminase family protein [Comamonadaceae bacterium]
MRAFEMPPHARMSADAATAAARADRALLEAALRSRSSCIRWGTELHDRYLLPHFVGADFDGRHRAR